MLECASGDYSTFATSVGTRSSDTAIVAQPKHPAHAFRTCPLLSHDLHMWVTQIKSHTSPQKQLLSRKR